MKPAEHFLKGLLALACLAASGCRQHTLEDGTYRLSAAQVVSDSCGLVASGQGQWTGTLQTTGDVVWLTLDLHGIQLRGRYLSNAEQFTAAGDAANVQATLNGQACTVPFLNVDLEAATQSPTAFTGSLLLAYGSTTPATPPPPNGACTCQLKTLVHAVRQ